MDVIKGVLSEDELRNFSAEDYAALADLISDALADLLMQYINATGQDEYVLDCVKSFLGNRIEILNFPTLLKEGGYLEALRVLSPSAIFSTRQDPAYLEDLHNKLKFLEANLDKITHVTPAREKEAYDKFVGSVKTSIAKAISNNQPLTYPDAAERVAANRFLFYTPQNKTHSTNLGIVSSKQPIWLLCLRGLEFKEYCDNKGISQPYRRTF